MAQKGNGPPPGAEPSDLWVKLTETPRPLSAEHGFHARGRELGKIRFRVLTARELASTRADANRETKKLLGDDAARGNLAYEEEYQQQLAYHLLNLAARQADAPEFPAFPRPADVQAELTDDEITEALQAYGAFRQETGPALSELTPDEMEAWLAVLAEGGSRFPLVRLSGAALTDLVMFLVSKLKEAGCSTATSSAGSPPAGSSTPTPPSAPGDEGASGPTT